MILGVHQDQKIAEKIMINIKNYFRVNYMIKYYNLILMFFIVSNKEIQKISLKLFIFI